MDFNQGKDAQGGENSVFAGVFPQPAAPPREAPRGPSADEAISAVRTKIDAMEKTILAQIEKKLAENSARAASQPPPPPPPPSPVPAILLRKIEELEGRLKDFQERSVISAGQLKSIEESKIGARREIEELLKAVREQQKFSELDRQMHEQLQKSWTRVEDLEKKLMDIFSFSAKQGAPEKSPVDADAVAKAVEAAVSPRLDAVARAMEAVVSPRLDAVARAVEAAVSPRLDAVAKAVEAVVSPRLDAVARAVEAAVSPRLSALASSVEQRLAALAGRLDAEISAQDQARKTPDRVEEKLFALREEMREAYAAAAAGLSENRAALREEFSGLIKAALRDESSLVEKYSREMLSLSRDRQDALAKNIAAQLDRLIIKSEDEGRRVSALSAALEKGSLEEEARARALSSDLERKLAAFGAEISVKISETQKEQTEKLKAVCGLAGSTLGGLEAALSSVLRFEGRLSELEKDACGIIKELDLVNLEGLLGVSGVVVRKNYEALKNSLEKFAEEKSFLAEARVKISSALGSRGKDPSAG